MTSNEASSILSTRRRCSRRRFPAWNARSPAASRCKSRAKIHDRQLPAGRSEIEHAIFIPASGRPRSPRNASLAGSARLRRASTTATNFPSSKASTLGTDTVSLGERSPNGLAGSAEVSSLTSKCVATREPRPDSRYGVWESGAGFVTACVREG
jgi:hypothetical protein